MSKPETFDLEEILREIDELPPSAKKKESVPDASALYQQILELEKKERSKEQRKEIIKKVAKSAIGAAVLFAVVKRPETILQFLNLVRAKAGIPGSFDKKQLRIIVFYLWAMSYASPYAVRMLEQLNLL